MVFRGRALHNGGEVISGAEKINTRIYGGLSLLTGYDVEANYRDVTLNDDTLRLSNISNGAILHHFFPGSTIEPSDKDKSWNIACQDLGKDEYSLRVFVNSSGETVNLNVPNIKEFYGIDDLYPLNKTYE